MESRGYFEYQVDPVSGEKIKVPANPEDVKTIENNAKNAPGFDAEIAVMAGVPLEALDVPLKKKRRNRKPKRPAQAIISDESALVAVEQTLHERLSVDLKKRQGKAGIESKSENHKNDALFAAVEANFREHIAKPENRKLSQEMAKKLAKKLDKLDRMAKNGEEEDDYYG